MYHPPVIIWFESDPSLFSNQNAFYEVWNAKIQSSCTHYVQVVVSMVGALWRSIKRKPSAFMMNYLSNEYETRELNSLPEFKAQRWNIYFIIMLWEFRNLMGAVMSDGKLHRYFHGGDDLYVNVHNVHPMSLTTDGHGLIRHSLENLNFPMGGLEQSMLHLPCSYVMNSDCSSWN